jgi:hypothetical protein
MSVKAAAHGSARDRRGLRGQRQTESLRHSTDRVARSGWRSSLLPRAAAHRALVPALWTLTFVTLGGARPCSALPISVGTSMISCIAVGAGVDFAIHLIFARDSAPAIAGQRAVDEIGVGRPDLRAPARLRLPRPDRLRDVPAARLRRWASRSACSARRLGACWLVPSLYAAA